MRRWREQNLFMQGDIGRITSARHPILGSILHYNPRWQFIPELNSRFGLSHRGLLTVQWLQRTWGACTVNNSFFNHRRRRAVQRLEGWMRHTRRLAEGDIVSKMDLNPETPTVKNIQEMSPSADGIQKLMPTKIPNLPLLPKS